MILFQLDTFKPKLVYFNLPLQKHIQIYVTLNTTDCKRLPNYCVVDNIFNIKEGNMYEIYYNERKGMQLILFGQNIFYYYKSEFFGKIVLL